MKQRPNLLYVFADQLRADALGCGGNFRARTPRLDQFARDSACFSNAVSSTPVCAPYRASLFTGKHTSSTGMVVNELRMNPSHYCFANALSDAGYETAYIGKWHLYADSSDHGDMKNQYVPPGPDRLGFDGYWAAYGFWHHYYRAFYFRDSNARIDVDGYEPDIQTGLAIEQLERLGKARKPFALFLSYGTVHDPWTRDNVPAEYLRLFEHVPFNLPETWSDTPDPYMDRFTDPKEWQDHIKNELPDNLRVYHAMTANLDWNVGRLLDALEHAGLAEDTIVIFTSDHGEMFGAHGRTQKLTFYEEAVRVPFYLRWPSEIGGGTTTDICLGTPDIMPTVLGLMNIAIPEQAREEIEGKDLSFALRSTHNVGPPSSDEPKAALLQGMGHTYQWKDGFEWRGLRSKRHTYAIYRRDGFEHLYDNRSDPLQANNLAHNPDHAETLREMRQLLKERMTEIGDTFESCTWYRDNWTHNRRILRGGLSVAPPLPKDNEE